MHRGLRCTVVCARRGPKSCSEQQLAVQAASGSSHFPELGKNLLARPWEKRHNSAAQLYMRYGGTMAQCALHFWEVSSRMRGRSGTALLNFLAGRVVGVCE